MALLAHTDARYLRTPLLTASGEGATLHAIAWDRTADPSEAEALLALPVTPDGTPRGEPEVRARRGSIPGLVRRDGAVEPTEDASAPDRAAADGWAARVERGGGRSAVWVTLPSGDPVKVWDAWGTAAAPCVRPVDEGAWVAFHHNVREDTGEPDLSKWIAVRFVGRDGSVREPAAPMTDRDRDREGEEQGFEFPSLAVGPDGALMLFGRGSHAFFRQTVNAAGFSPREALGDGSSWGCRGRWVAVCPLADGRALTARREKKGLVVEPVDAPTGGPPALRDATVDLPRRPHPDVPARPHGPDPAARDGRRTLFGDIHQHSAHSDGVGSAEEPYLRARYVYGDDFCALTDHESFIGKRIGPGEWAYLCGVAEAHDDPGHFATLIAYEWTGRMYPGPGHKVVYLPPEGGPIVSRDEVPEGAEIVRRVKALGGFAVPHHVGWTGADEEGHDPEGQPVWEICSCHGCYLHADHPLGARGGLKDQMVEAVMKRGKRFGFIACSDGHGLLYHHGVGRKRDPFRCGLTAVQAEGCTRQAILDAIRARRCYATSGVPILLDLRAGGAPMGSEVTVDGPVPARAEARCASPIESLMLIGPDGPLATVAGAGQTEATLEATVEPGWVYARVEQTDGEMAWSSPIWLDP
ncbi:MAG TPA: CehA/McbA family metallohydrolase [Sandaracinaceae bacterium LLY-WYZ-13_1]|nr:CehA/McbA family metallohydrolase [Sandaracinaceae bacterium LLY-WYZ-13_1]